MNDFFVKIINVLNELRIPYMLSGSVAMSLYILPRATRDFDFVVHLQKKDIELFTAKFSEGYYCNEEAIKEAQKNSSMFNIIDHASGFKADFVFLKNTPFRQEEFRRKVKIEYFSQPIYVVTAEDLLISKLVWIQEYQSAIQMEDIQNLCALSHLDWEYIHQWIKKLGLNTFNLL